MENENSDEEYDSTSQDFMILQEDTKSLQSLMNLRVSSESENQDMIRN